jgi:Organic solute transporter Ostalpha
VDSETALFGNWTFHRLGLWIAAGFALVASGIAFILIFLHATHYSRPQEQRKYAIQHGTSISPLARPSDLSYSIIRILLMIPIYATVSFLSYKFYRYAIYWETIRDCYEAFAIASFFHLLCFYLEPTLHEQKKFFRTLKPKNWVLPLNWIQPCTGGPVRGLFRVPRSGLTWFNVGCPP